MDSGGFLFNKAPDPINLRPENLPETLKFATKKQGLIVPNNTYYICSTSNTFTCELPAWTDTMLGSKNNVFSKKAQ